MDTILLLLYQVQAPVSTLKDISWVVPWVNFLVILGGVSFSVMKVKTMMESFVARFEAMDAKVESHDRDLTIIKTICSIQHPSHADQLNQ